MKKVLVSIIFISILSITLLNSVNSADTICITHDDERILGGNFKDYRDCRIRTPQGEVDGIAYLFPGYFSSDDTVERAFGILTARDAIMNCLFFDDDYYFSNWSFAIVFSFDGYFQNFWDGPYRIFEIDGTAKFVRVYF